ncbi:ABC transporter ATP-binding protein [Kiritimatiella glycovorans]|uniref:Putative ABC transporter ATP-binding protein n=1 Tax=Kiritimatiella glycovorans TaxID=1307763 RepID=A0A0G3EH27_9BACT|nr:ATP-binding cassette domain-containing protein [Kiritimatiella glycovorans]AKJ63439.1 putative ABC transporter ATP-binding protein [Kiritimatiella glycovorans]
MNPILKIDDVHKTLRGLKVLRGATLEVMPHEVVGLIGGSGEGKSVLLKHAAGLMRPDHGHVYVDGDDLCCLSRRHKQSFYDRLGFLFQNGALFDSLSVYENITFPLREQGLGEQEIRERIRTVLGHVGLEGSEEKLPGQLSGGMLKRAALARALIKFPEIMLFDEPTTGLDPLIVRTIHNLIHSCQRELNYAGIIVTHEIPAIFGLVQKVAFLYEGRIRFYGTPEEVHQTNDPVLREFIDSATMTEDPVTWHGCLGTNNGGA